MILSRQRQITETLKAEVGLYFSQTMTFLDIFLRQEVFIFMAGLEATGPEVYQQGSARGSCQRRCCWILQLFPRTGTSLAGSPAWLGHQPSRVTSLAGVTSLARSPGRTSHTDDLLSTGQAGVRVDDT